MAEVSEHMVTKNGTGTPLYLKIAGISRLARAFYVLRALGSGICVRSACVS